MSKFLTPPVWYDKNGNLNDMLTGEAFDYGVAVGSKASAGRGGVAVGVEASAYEDGVAVGINATANDYGIAIGSNATSDGYGIAIGGNSTGGGIAIGGNAAANKVQLGSTNTTYDLTVGNGNGTINGVRFGEERGVIQIGDMNTEYKLNIGNGGGNLTIGGITGTPKIGSIAFTKMAITDNKVAIEASGVYLCCTTTGSGGNLTSSVAICFINETFLPATVLSSNGSCSYDKVAKKIQAGDGFTIKYCFKIVSL